MYIDKADYKGRISLDLLNMLLEEDEPGILALSSHIAEDTLKSTAGVLYDIDAELIKTSTDRNYYVLSLAISIALYEIYQRSDEESVPEKVIKNHDDAMDDLIKISNGKAVLNLPPKPVIPPETGTGGEDVTIEGSGLRRLGSQPKRTHQV